tara:strand:+ start:2076 stop:2405 length:330 start_codon:yes stop_codon:yes gene_type:complete
VVEFFLDIVMGNINILYIGRHLEILSTVVRLINANADWSGIGALNDEEAKCLFQEKKFEIVLLGPGITDESEKHLRLFFRKQNSNTAVVQHYGGGSGLLKTEILMALNA